MSYALICRALKSLRAKDLKPLTHAVLSDPIECIKFNFLPRRISNVNKN